ncbi:hypothetical protein SAMN05421771_3757 [Granulicella pectinivorans]|uniref:Uncharacterized protein n=1 Tax=Granulicella pectinivorans TaxID=474950 RepID=A0A1I6MY91_9BACT|nr:hypothetical protein [Granulicella pectinivorans]SFS20672.1 hypothetical protein SAMN05421771_3757 [Granulicella pectinivorans]
MQTRTRRITWGFTLFTVILACGFAYLSHYLAVDHTGVPVNMPSDSTFIPGKFDYLKLHTRGEWVSCHSDVKSPTDWCRIANQSGDVIFEGKFLPVGMDKPLVDSQIHITSYNIDHHMVTGPTESFEVPVIPLEDGELLVPATDARPLALRWKQHPNELVSLNEGMAVPIN